MVKTEKHWHVKDNTRAPTTIPLVMNMKSVAFVAVAFVLLLYGTVAVFEAFDRYSNSASDTIRPFVITMGPVWVLSIAAARVLLRRPYRLARWGPLSRRPIDRICSGGPWP